MSQRTICHEMLAETIANIHRASRGCYGARRVHAELGHGRKSASAGTRWRG